MFEEGREEGLSEAFRRLGQNLVETIKSAHDSPEARKLRSEVEEGLSELRTAINQASEDFRASPTHQRLQDDVAEFADRVQRGELAEKARRELLHAIDLVNNELKGAQERWNADQDGPEQDVVSQDPAGPAE